MGTDYGKLSYIKLNELENNLRISKKNISKNAQDIEDIRNEISGGIDVTALNQTVLTHTNQIANMQNTLNTQSTTITKNTDDIEESITNIETLQDAVSNINNTLDTTTNNIATLQSQITSLSSSIANNTTQINQLAQNNTENTLQISANTNNISNINDLLETLESNYSNIDSQISTLDTAIDTINGTLDNNVQLIDDMSTNLTELSTQVEDINNDLQAIEETINTMPTQSATKSTVKFTERLSVLHTGTQSTRIIKFAFVEKEKYSLHFDIKLYSNSTPKNYKINIYINEVLTLYDSFVTQNNNMYSYDMDWVANCTEAKIRVEFVPSDESTELSVEFVKFIIVGVGAKCLTAKNTFTFTRNKEGLALTFCNGRDVCVFEDISQGVEIPSTFTSVLFTKDNLNHNAFYISTNKYELVDGVIEKTGNEKPFVFFHNLNDNGRFSIYQIEDGTYIETAEPLQCLDDYMHNDAQPLDAASGCCTNFCAAATSSTKSFIRWVHFNYNGKVTNPSPIAGNALSSKNALMRNLKLVAEADVKYLDSTTPRTQFDILSAALFIYEGGVYMFFKEVNISSYDAWNRAYLCEGDLAFGFYTTCDRDKIVIFVVKGDKSYKRFYSKNDVEYTEYSGANLLWDFVGEVQLDFEFDNLYLLYGKIYYEHEGKVYIKDDTYTLSTENG